MRCAVNGHTVRFPSKMYSVFPQVTHLWRRTLPGAVSGAGGFDAKDNRAETTITQPGCLLILRGQWLVRNAIVSCPALISSRQVVQAIVGQLEPERTSETPVVAGRAVPSSTLALFGASADPGETEPEGRRGILGRFPLVFPWEVQSVRSRINRCSGTYDPLLSATCPCWACFLPVNRFLGFCFDEFLPILNGPCSAQLLMVA